MKKISVFVFALLLALPLSLSVSAADDYVVSVDVVVTTPAADLSVGKAPIGEATVAAVINGETKELAVHLDFDVISYAWKEKDSGLILEENDRFVSGRIYVLQVEMELITEIPVTGETSFTLGGKEAMLKQAGERGEKLTLSREYVAVPENFEPQVSLTVEGTKRREFDGKGITLTALVEEIDGISYEYAWYRDMILVEGAKDPSFTVRDVAQSGKYLCTVTARVTDDPTVEPKTTRTASHDIEITPTVITVQIENAEKNLMDPDPRFSYTVLGNVHDPMQGSLERQKGEDIGKYTIMIGSLSFAEDKIANYQILVRQGTLSILAVGELPFSAVADIADLSYISGAQKAKIRVSASKGAIPDDAILSLSTASSEARSALADTLGRSVMKAFSVSIVSADGKSLSLPGHASLRLQIPLTEEEAKLDTKTIAAGFYSSSAAFVETEISESEGVTYINLEISALGTVALFDGSAVAPTPNGGDGNGEEKDGGGLWLWILIGVVSAAAVGGIAFTVVFTLKNKKGAPRPQKNKKAVKEPEPDPLAEALSTDAAEKEKQEKIARELNEQPPVPTATKEKPKKKATKTVVSFEDLED